MNYKFNANPGPAKVKLNRAERLILGVLERKLGLLVADRELEANLGPSLPAAPGAMQKRVSSIRKKLAGKAVIHSFRSGTHIMLTKSWPRTAQNN